MFFYCNIILCFIQISLSALNLWILSLSGYGYWIYDQVAALYNGIIYYNLFDKFLESGKDMKAKIVCQVSS